MASTNCSPDRKLFLFDRLSDACEVRPFDDEAWSGPSVANIILPIPVGPVLVSDDRPEGLAVTSSESKVASNGSPVA
jgi:hypothetical protein